MPVPEGDGGRVYLDYAATAPFDQRLREVMGSVSWANAAALYAEGREAARQLEDARKRIATALGARTPSEIIFTSGGTESDNMALKGILRRMPGGRGSHVVISAMEHHAVLEAADSCKAEGFRVDRLAPDHEGIVQPDALRGLLADLEAKGEKAALVAVQAVNNELGTVQPVRELATIAHEHGARFLCDAVQALGKIDIDLEASGVDAAAFSAHKIGALKGFGVLYLRRSVSCAPLIHGGGQEAGMRSGTSNVLGAVAFATAIEYALDSREEVWKRVDGLRKRLLDALLGLDAAHALEPTIPETVPHVPHILPLICDSLEGETLVMRLDDAGVAASSGSACSTGSLDPSHVLTAIGIPRERAYGSLRLSFGPGTTEADIDKLVDVLAEVLR